MLTGRRFLFLFFIHFHLLTSYRTWTYRYDLDHLLIDPAAVAKIFVSISRYQECRTGLSSVIRGIAWASGACSILSSCVPDTQPHSRILSRVWFTPIEADVLPSCGDMTARGERGRWQEHGERKGTDWWVRGRELWDYVNNALLYVSYIGRTIHDSRLPKNLDPKTNT